MNVTKAITLPNEQHKTEHANERHKSTRTTYGATEKKGTEKKKNERHKSNRTPYDARARVT
jgi:hypothetical protein